MDRLSRYYHNLVFITRILISLQHVISLCLNCLAFQNDFLQNLRVIKFIDCVIGYQIRVNNLLNTCLICGFTHRLSMLCVADCKDSHIALPRKSTFLEIKNLNYS